MGGGLALPLAVYLAAGEGAALMATAGGRRPGQGRPTEHKEQAAGKRQADLRVQRALQRFTDEQIDQFVDVLMGQALAGDAASQKLLMEHLKGRAATQAPVEADTTINVIALDIPRSGGTQWRALYDSLCSKCKPKLMVARRKQGEG